MEFEKAEYKQLFNECLIEKRIVKSNQIFKQKLFLEKAENSIQIAQHIKKINPTKDQPKRVYWDYWAITIGNFEIY